MLYSDSGKGLVSKHPVRALQTLRTAEQLDPWSLPTQYAVAAAYARLDDYQAARAALLRAAQLEPENYVPQALLIASINVGAQSARVSIKELTQRMLPELRSAAAALAAYRRALALDPLEPALQQAVDSSRKAQR